MTFFGTARESGGRFENHLNVVFRYGVGGRIVHIECFEAEQVAEALARFDEVTGGGTGAVADWFENAAARTDRALFARFNARDWPGIEALAAPDLVFDERRRMLHNTCGRDIWLEQFRVLYDVPASRFTTKLLGTRGERLSLSLHKFTGEVAGGGGPLEMDDHLVLHEVDAEGRLVTIMLFDLEDEAAAWAELDAGWFWLAIAPYGGACTARRSGRLASGGEFESDFLLVLALECGRVTRYEIFETDAVEAALACFAELGAASAKRGGTG